jgi:exopolysaccharide production protein ExoQ
MRILSIENCVCATILAFFAVQGAVPFIAPNQALEASNAAASGLTYWGGIISQILVYGAIGFFICLDFRRVVQWLCAMRWTAGIACFGIASSIWSQFPLFTLRRSLPFALAGLFGLCVAVRYPVRRQLLILWLAMVALAAGTIILALFFPRVGLDASAGHFTDWQGMFTSKNGCGRIMVLATAVALCQRKGWAYTIFSLALFVPIVGMSGSRGAWLIEALVLASYLALLACKGMDSRSRVLLLVFGSLAIVAVTVAVASNYAAVAAFVGRDATLTGRTVIWRHVWPFIMERPLLGWGYAAFWRGTQGEAFRVVAAMRFIIFHAHNGFLEIWLEMGAVGLFLVVGSYLRAWRKLWPHLRRGQVNRVMWMVFVLVLIGLYDLDENTLLIYNGLFWVLYVATLVNIELLAFEDKLTVEISALLMLQETDADRKHVSSKLGLGLI